LKRDVILGRARGGQGLIEVYAWRLFAALFAFGIVMVPVMIVLWVIANRGPIPPGW